MNESLPPDGRRVSYKSLDSEAMAAARRAAEASGVSLQEWLSRTILENARRSGIVPEDPSRQVAGTTGQASAEEAVHAIARHLERAKSAADSQGLSLADWLSRAILTNAIAGEAPQSRRNRMPPPPAPAPDLGAVLRGESRRPRAELPVTPPRFHSRRAAHANQAEADLPDARTLPDVLAGAGTHSAAMPPPGAADAPRRRRSGPLWAMLAILLVIAGGIWALPHVVNRAGETTSAAVPPAAPGRADTAALPGDAKIADPAKPPPAQAKPPEIAKKPDAAPPAAAPPAKPVEKADATPGPPAAKDTDPKTAESKPGEGRPEAKAPDKPLPEPAENDLARMPAKDMPKPPAAHLDWYRKAADAGNAEAQYALAELYLKGDGVGRDYKAAAAMFRRAADKGNLARAQYALGLLFQRGLGVARSDVEAVLWWQKAADQNFMPAVTWVGLSLLEGKGIQKDEAAARKMLERAAEGDEPNAQYTLGRIYERGMGVTRDAAVAMKWFILAAEQAHPQATQKVEELSTTLPRDVQERATGYVTEHYSRFRKR